MLSQTSTSPSDDSSSDFLDEVLPFTGESSQNKDNNEIIDYVEDCLKKDYDLQDLDELSKDLKSNDRLKQHHGAIGIRKIVTNSTFLLNIS